jgi:hypothetical protein
MLADLPQQCPRIFRAVNRYPEALTVRFVAVRVQGVLLSEAELLIVPAV